MNKFIGLLALFFSTFASASDTLASLNVEGDIVLFSTINGKSSTLTCVTTDNNNLWSVSLNQKSGRALYAVLVAALSGNNSIEVTSGNDCADTSGVERAFGVNVIGQPSATKATDNIFNNIIEVDANVFYSSKNKTYSKQENYFQAVFTQTSNTGIYRSVGQGIRVRVVNLVGKSGWFTGLLTPSIYPANGKHKEITIEVVIDQVSHVFTLVQQSNQFTRWFMGLADNSTQDAAVIAHPLEVISKNKAIRFEQSLEVYVTMGETPYSSGWSEYMGVHYVLSDTVN